MREAKFDSALREAKFDSVLREAKFDSALHKANSVSALHKYIWNIVLEQRLTPLELMSVFKHMF